MSWKIVKRKDLDVSTWDQIVDQYGNGLPYSKSWYLDICCSQWEAAILNDYEAICALPFNRKKIGFKQLYTPFFVQQLGWIAKNELHDQKVQSFFGILKGRYLFIHYAFNEININELSIYNSFPLKTNLIIDLSKNYENIYSQYSKGLKSSIKKAGREKLQIRSTPLRSEHWKIFKSTLQLKATSLKSKDFETINALIQYCVDHQWGKLWEVRSESDELLSVAFFLVNDKRMINLFQANNDMGRQSNAISYLFDKLIEENADTPIIFDFEGSEIESIQRFMKSFGAENRPYPVMTKTWV